MFKFEFLAPAFLALATSFGLMAVSSSAIAADTEKAAAVKSDREWYEAGDFVIQNQQQRERLQRQGFGQYSQ